MNPKGGKACKIIKPEEPTVADPADEADPGEIAETKSKQKETKTGKYGSVEAKPFKPIEHEPGEMTTAERSWIEIQLLDEADEPVPGEAYTITLPDGRESSGMTDSRGWARVWGFEPGSCQITFPRLDEEAWEEIDSTGSLMESEEETLG